MGLGGIALADMLIRRRRASAGDRGVLGQPHFAPKAKRIIYLFMSGGPSQLDLFDYKPLLNRAQRRAASRLGARRPAAHRHVGKSVVDPARRLAVSSLRSMAQAGAWFSELLPHTATIADDICVVRSMFTEAINHGPGVTFFQTGSQIAGRPSIGAWLSYGLGQENANLPSFVVLITKGKGGQPLGSHLWGSGFLAGEASGRAVPRGEGSGALSRKSRRASARRAGGMMLDRLRELHEHQLGRHARCGDPEPDRSIRDGLSHADEHPGGDRSFAGIAGDARDSTGRM